MLSAPQNRNALKKMRFFILLKMTKLIIKDKTINFCNLKTNLFRIKIFYRMVIKSKLQTI